MGHLTKESAWRERRNKGADPTSSGEQAMMPDYGKAGKSMRKGWKGLMKVVQASKKANKKK